MQGTGTVTTGYNDNILTAPDNPTIGAPPRQGDVQVQLRPGAALTSQAPRFIERLAYTFTADLFARHSEANSYSNALAWTGTLLASPTTRLTLNAQSQQGRISTFTINQSSADATVTAISQNADTNFFSQQAGQALESNPDPAWRVLEATSFQAFIPIDRGRLPDTYTVDAAVGGDRLFRSDALGLVLRCEIVDFAAARDPSTDVPLGFDRQQVLTSLVARWRRDWSRAWNSEAALGVVSIVGLTADPASPTETTWQPSALAALRWVDDAGNAEVHYAHLVAPNTLAGNTFVTDEAALQAGLPLARGKVVIGATVAYQHTRLLPLVAGVTAETANLVLLDATVGWQPMPELRVFARYSLFDQFGTNPQPGLRPILPDLTRNVVMVGAEVIYPAVASLRAPVRGASRVDESDQQSFPEPHAPPPK